MAEGGFTAVVLDHQWARKVVVFNGNRIAASRVYPGQAGPGAVSDWALVEHTVENVLFRGIARRWAHPNDPKVWSLHLRVGS